MTWTHLLFEWLLTLSQAPTLQPPMIAMTTRMCRWFRILPIASHASSLGSLVFALPWLQQCESEHGCACTSQLLPDEAGHHALPGSLGAFQRKRKRGDLRPHGKGGGPKGREEGREGEMGSGVSVQAPVNEYTGRCTR